MGFFVFVCTCVNNNVLSNACKSVQPERPNERPYFPLVKVLLAKFPSRPSVSRLGLGIRLRLDGLSQGLDLTPTMRTLTVHVNTACRVELDETHTIHTLPDAFRPPLVGVRQRLHQPIGSGRPDYDEQPQ